MGSVAPYPLPNGRQAHLPPSRAKAILECSRTLNSSPPAGEGRVRGKILLKEREKIG